MGTATLPASARVGLAGSLAKVPVSGVPVRLALICGRAPSPQIGFALVRKSHEVWPTRVITPPLPSEAATIEMFRPAPFSFVAPSRAEARGGLASHAAPAGGRP